MDPLLEDRMLVALKRQADAAARNAVVVQLGVAAATAQKPTVRVAILLVCAPATVGFCAMAGLGQSPTMPKRKRAAIYLRVSREEQAVENQLPDIKRILRTRKLKQAATFEEKASAARARPEFQAMMEAAHRGDFDVLVVWSLDRLGRSMTGNMQAVLDLDRFGVEVISVREPWLDTGGPVRSLLIAIFGWVAEQERIQIGERTKAGLARARRKGIKIGRPERRIDLARAKKLRKEGLSLRQAAKKLGVPTSTLHRALERPKKGSS